MSTTPHIRQQGLSLVELLLGLAITALIMLPLLPMLQTASAADSAVTDQAVLERDADFALNRIAARIRVTDPKELVAGKPSTEWLKPAVYSLSNGSLIEQVGGVNYVLADSVKDFSLDAPVITSNEPLVIVTLALARGNASTSASIAVRMESLP
jgi:hypothetical protein